VKYTREQIQARVEDLKPWFHNMDVGGVRTAPDHFLFDYPNVKFQRFAAALPPDLSGKSVLDIGCNGGFYAMEMKRRGAARVLGIDWDERYLAQARFAADVAELDIAFEKLSVYDVGVLGERFDLVIFMGVLYHLRHPLLALDLIHEHVAGDLLLFQSMLRGSGAVTPIEQDYPIKKTAMFARSGFPRLHFVEHSYSGDPTNWWIPNRACAEAMLRSSGFDILGQIEAEVFLCKRRAVAEPGAVYPARSEA
jgi:tRNA (mo5U34)-methyltransferase